MFERREGGVAIGCLVGGGFLIEGEAKMSEGEAEGEKERQSRV